MKLQMVDLQGQYLALKQEIDAAIAQVLANSHFINGPDVTRFAQEFAAYNQVPYVITCANGTDALQLALMALDLQPGEEVIVPAFTYVATAEAIALLGLTPVFADVDPHTFLLTAAAIEEQITSRTKAIVPVHLFGQCTDMAPILALAKKHDLYVIEDTAQAIGAAYTFPDGTAKKAGTMGHIGTTSFFPSKNLGCYGDGGALLVQEDALAAKLQMLANHGQKQKYHHDLVGINSRLDTLQAAILSVKLRHLDIFNGNRQASAAFYNEQLALLPGIKLPTRAVQSTHVFHQYTLICSDISREALRAHLQQQGIPSMVYYPLPLHRQKAYEQYHKNKNPLPVSEKLSNQVLSLPIHTEQDPEQLIFITAAIKEFTNQQYR
ncbi:DegT/DnrJ/EryC1/StrS family aminotransferase [Pontibacter qinzhouensis]|uniref:DegT/DnrJ/EryC1/StrS family aminotransferase n=1 Tax=Pontibacter qinzhouensis TaxID=2603253 RepID=A0A5C8IMI7_9BACT|nr:DegT/DnrJ/EryC1/StrS family aminotransferase [Pontibacter qinzhouensis]TXK22420.1 DegT/DnrJ/EryC1/StrS family aminotransferase [Pontibacter qinzhouensis]